jgi:hypothetical protein
MKANGRKHNTERIRHRAPSQKAKKGQSTTPKAKSEKQKYKQEQRKERTENILRNTQTPKYSSHHTIPP